MAGYLIRRLLQTVLVLAGVTVLVFVLVRMSGDPAALYLAENVPEAQLQQFRHDMGWDQPIPIQFASYVARMAHGDFGMSIRHNEPAMPLILDRLPATLSLAAVSLLFAVIVGVPAGILSGVYRNSALDAIARAVALLGLCFPQFWLGTMLIIVFAVQLQVLPAFGGDSLASLILPGVTLGLGSAATIMRLLRSNVLEVLGSDYVRTARAKGLAERLVLLRHVLRNAAIPSITVIGLQLGYLLGGAVVTETVFAYPGMGRLAVQSITNRDFSVTQAFVMLTAAVFALANLAVDAFYTVLDPRIRY